ncbi:MAG: helix-turn-helix domain-containing protein [Lachnospiraceae bacterium]
MTLGEKIKVRRLELGMSQLDLAKKLGYKNTSSVSRAEANEVDLPRTRIIEYANALETTPAFLMGFTEDVDSSKEDAGSIYAQYLKNVPVEKFEDGMFARYNALFDLVKDAPPEEMDQIEQIVKVIVKGNKKDD